MVSDFLLYFIDLTMSVTITVIEIVSAVRDIWHMIILKQIKIGVKGEWVDDMEFPEMEVEFPGILKKNSCVEVLGFRPWNFRWCHTIL